MFKIGDFSKLSNLSVRMLRHYDTLELLKPVFIDSTTNYRYYDASQLERVNQIRKLQKLGFSLTLIGDILENQSSEQLLHYFETRMSELDEEKEKLTIQASMLTHISDIIREDMTIMNYDVVIKELPERQVASVRKVVPTFNDEGELWGILYQELEEQTVSFAQPSNNLAIYHDKEYKETDVDIEVQVSVIGSYSNTSEVSFYVAPESTIASVTFSGGYEQMPDVTQTIAQWISDNHYEIVGPMVNIFHVSPSEEPNSEKWVTESAFIVQKLH